MIIMINGAFGTGKTTVAAQLHSLLPGSMIYDPEQVGYMLREMIPSSMQLPYEQTGDFQDMDLWKLLVVQVAAHLQQQYRRHLIVPMTICNREKFEFIHHGFIQLDPDTYHFCLLASRAVIHQRLRKRGEVEGNWCFQQTDRCLKAYHAGGFDEYIQTDQLNIMDIVQYIMSRITTRNT
ncbi:AAA family ATPase [Paenibacillus bovis]|uniref:Tunicamycin resistance protein n=1 Tax=Paenibacillus bovis TaxID=1616788 RepID=A0A172ZI15_9BACL|nr:AAA family ATPase [Paenibacillus bovis]ANF97281.1 tunicamycin resistance protein [Paenibacillus bovis]